MDAAEWSQLRNQALQSEVTFSKYDDVIEPVSSQAPEVVDAPHEMTQDVPSHPATEYPSGVNDLQEVEIERPAHEKVYEVIRQVGIGGLGEVWEGIHPSLARTIAMKRIREDLYVPVNNDTARMRRLEKFFRQEAYMTATLEHPNIVPVYDLGRDPKGNPILAMKLIRGKGWDLLLMNTFTMPMADFLDKHLPILIDVGQAVAFAHSKGIVHRDLKPSQVMVGEFGEVLLADWGLALIVDDELFRQANPHLHSMDIVPTHETATNPAGTPVYMAPEQMENDAQNVGNWTDVFLLGGMLYYILTGAPPHRGATMQEIQERARICDIIPPQQRSSNPEIPQELADLCMHALQRNPSERIGSAREFVQQLQLYLTGAGKRRESRMLTRKVGEQLFRAQGRYGELAECESLLTRALGLWPENPAADPLRQKVLFSFAQSASDNGDLVLARVQAERLREGPERAELLAEINAMEKLGTLAETETRDMETARRTAVRERDNAVAEMHRMQDAYHGMLGAFMASQPILSGTLAGIAAERRVSGRSDYMSDFVRQGARLLLEAPPTEDSDQASAVSANLHIMKGLLDEQGDSELSAKTLQLLGSLTNSIRSSSTGNWI
ncbi:hypothetical protein BH09SUM1_BH09SUM1_26170 [soil metagenome]